MKTKICTKCGVEKSLDEFLVDKKHKNGKTSVCKLCFKKYRQENKYYITNYAKKYRKENREKINNYAKKYREKYKKQINIKKNKYHIKRRKIDIRYTVKCNLRNRIWHALKTNTKSLSTMMLIGCEIDYLLFHLQSQFTKGMSWDNYGRGWDDKGLQEWHIDHIKPCASFNLTKPEDQQKCFNYTNLQPLWAKDNLSKHDKWSIK